MIKVRVPGKRPVHVVSRKQAIRLGMVLEGILSFGLIPIIRHIGRKNKIVVNAVKKHVYTENTVYMKLEIGTNGDIEKLEVPTPEGQQVMNDADGAYSVDSADYAWLLNGRLSSDLPNGSHQIMPKKRGSKQK